MNTIILKNIKIAAYFLWEYYKQEKAMELWYCAEDIAHYFQVNGYTEFSKLKSLRSSNIDSDSSESSELKNIIREVAYKLYEYTDSRDRFFNWIIAEKLLHNDEWCQAIVTVAELYGGIDQDKQIISSIHSEKVKNYYLTN